MRTAHIENSWPTVSAHSQRHAGKAPTGIGWPARAQYAPTEMELLARWLLSVGAMVTIIALFVAVYITDRRAEQRYGRAIEQREVSDLSTADPS